MSQLKFLVSTIDTMIVNANAERNRGRYSSANKIYKRCLYYLFYSTELERRTIVLKELAFSYVLKGDFESSEKVESYLADLILNRCELIDSGAIEILKFTLARLTVLRIVTGDFNGADTSIGALLSHARISLSEKKLIPILNLYGSLKFRLEKYEESESLYRESLELSDKLKTYDNCKMQNRIDALKGLGISLCSQGKEVYGRFYCSHACASMEQVVKSTIANELSQTVQNFCSEGNFGYIKPICKFSQWLSLQNESSSLPDRLKAYACLLKYLVPEFRVDEIDIRIERLQMAS